MGNSMIIKTALATLITASLAGSVVYYGTHESSSASNEVMLDSHPHSSAKMVEDEIVQDNGSIDEDRSSERVIDKLLKRDADKETVTTETTTTETTITETTVMDDAEEIMPVEQAESDPSMPASGDEDVKEVDVEVAYPIQTIDDGYEKLAMAEIGKNNLLDTVFAQAEIIKAAELKDQAYLDIVTYAVTHKLYSASDKAMEKIGQVELRDTARSQIAISLAKDGNTTEAFALIDQVETEELRDIMRLQVIEAMILPTRLPAPNVQY